MHQPGDNTIACHFLAFHAEIDTAMGDIHIVFFKRAFIEQHVDAFTRRQLTLGVLCIIALLATAQTRFGPPCFHFAQKLRAMPPP